MSEVLVDTSVWVAHFRRADPVLQRLLQSDLVLVHPLVLLELACGTPPAPREKTLGSLRTLRSCTVATIDETLQIVERERLFDSGCGAVDVALVASALLTPDCRLWTRDRALASLAESFAVAYAAEAP